MLDLYLTRTARLLQNPAAPITLYATSDLTDYINEARGQIAGESECVRVQGTLALTAGTSVYPFSSIVLPNADVLGYQGVINVRQSLSVVSVGQQWMRPRGFEWFTLYKLNNTAPVPGPPNEWSQYGQGANGSLYVDPVPDVAYSLNLDCVVYPINLALDTDPEALPYLWTDAVPFFAAFFALLASQGSARQQDADRMFQRYQMFMDRARKAATPTVLPAQYQQIPSPADANIYGIAPRQQQAAGGG